MIIYKLINLINGKIYIGKTKKNLNRRVRIYCKELDVCFFSTTDAAIFLGGVQSNISSVLNGKLKKYKGYTFERINHEL